MKNRKRFRNVFLMMTVSVALSLCACREVNDTLYLKYADIPADGWQTYHQECFNPTAADSTWFGQPMALELLVRYRSDSPMADFPVLCDIEDENGEIRRDTLVLRTFRPDGRPLSPGKFGICEATVSLAKQLPLTRGLSVCIMPLGPKSASRGLMSVGIKMCHYGLNASESRESR